MEKCEIAGYFATLSKEELQEFLRLFFELEINTGTDIHIRPINGAFKVNMEANGSMYAPLLVSSFTDGMMYHRGWDQKFQRIKEFVQM